MYVNAFLKTLTPTLQQQLRQLLDFDSLAEQQAYFQSVIEAADSGFVSSSLPISTPPT